MPGLTDMKIPTNSSNTDLSWLPTDCDEQLNLGFRIIAAAYKSRINSLEADVRSYKSELAEKSEQMQLLNRKQNSFEVQLIEETQKSNQIAEENKQLIAMVKKLNKDIARLETFKKNVEASIKEERLDCTDYQKFYNTDDILQSTAPRTMQELNRENNSNDFGLNNLLLSKSTSSVPGSSLLNSLSEYNDHDLKTFFKIVKDRLSSIKYSQFVLNVQLLNNKRQSKEETLQKAAGILGTENDDLYRSFAQILGRKSESEKTLVR